MAKLFVLCVCEEGEIRMMIESTKEDLLAQIEYLQSRIEALEKDAARYAFVKTMSREMFFVWSGVYKFSNESIDTAMQSEKGGV